MPAHVLCICVIPTADLRVFLPEWCLFFFRGRFCVFFGGFLVLGFPVSLIFCFSASLLKLLLCFSCFCFLLSLLLCFSCFSAFPASLLFCFSVFPASLLLYFCAFLLLLFYLSFLQSCVFAALLPAPLNLCFLSFLSLCFCSRRPYRPWGIWHFLLCPFVRSIAR